MSAASKVTSKRIVSIVIKTIVISAACSYIFFKIKNQNNLDEYLEYLIHSISKGANVWMLFVASVLVFVNWGLEATKWRRVVNRIQPITFVTSFMATFAGVTSSVFTPNRVGEFAGRMLFVEEENRGKAILASAICSFGQLLITISLGSIALLAFISLYTELNIETQILSILTSILGLAILLALLFYYRFDFIKDLLKPLSRQWKALKRTLKLFNSLNSSDYSFVLFASLLRFITYCIQFFLLLTFFNAGISAVDATVLLPLNFLGITAIPSIALAELGVREAVALGFLDIHGSKGISIVSATFLLWLMNVAFPAILGSVFLAKVRIFNTNG